MLPVTHTHEHPAQPRHHQQERQRQQQTSVDERLSIAHDVCGRRCHAAGIAMSEESVPEQWKCWMCAAQNHLSEPLPFDDFIRLPSPRILVLWDLL